VRVGQAPFPDVRLEILDGPNSGKVTFSNQDGRYRFDDLVASPTFNIRFVKTGYQPGSSVISKFRHNQQHDVGWPN
jgi:hypothetical protein